MFDLSEDLLVLISRYLDLEGVQGMAAIFCDRMSVLFQREHFQRKRRALETALLFPTLCCRLGCFSQKELHNVAEFYCCTHGSHERVLTPRNGTVRLRTVVLLF